MTARALAIIGVWLAAVGLYAWDYLLGFAMLYALSALHVMLELPLNHQSFAGIGRELGRFFARSPVPVVVGPPLSRSRKAGRQRAQKR